MDWLQFIASVTGSLAWPLLGALPIILLRKELRELAQRVTEVTFPGGGASFGDKIARAEMQIGTRKNKVPATVTDKSNPRIRILDDFDSVAEVLSSKIAELPLDQRLPPFDFLFRNLYKDDKVLYDTYARAIEIRSSASYAKDGDIKIDDADKFEELCGKIKARFSESFTRWKATQQD